MDNDALRWPEMEKNDDAIFSGTSYLLLCFGFVMMLCSENPVVVVVVWLLDDVETENCCPFFPHFWTSSFSLGFGI